MQCSLRESTLLQLRAAWKCLQVGFSKVLEGFPTGLMLYRPRQRKYKHGPDRVREYDPDTMQPESVGDTVQQQISSTAPKQPVSSQAKQNTLGSCRSSAPPFLSPAPARVDYEAYYGESIPTHQQTEDDQIQGQPNQRVTESSKAILQLFEASGLPTSAWQASLLENFLLYARPLMPIVDLRWLQLDSGYTMPTILLKAILLAGARTTNTQPPFSSEEYYYAIKAMMFHSCERNPITKVIVACVIGWYNQADTLSVTIDSSSAWLRFASNIAYQIGLHKELQNQDHAGYRRRLWWTLVVVMRSLQQHCER